MGITDHLCSMAFRSGSRQGRIRKNSIDMDNLRFLCKFTVYFDIFRFQRLFLMQNRLSYTAFFYDLQSTCVNIYRHIPSFLYFSQRRIWFHTVFNSRLYKRMAKGLPNKMTVANLSHDMVVVPAR